MDITNSMQRLHEKKSDESKYIWETADRRFFWNQNMLESFMNVEDAYPFILPIMMGYVSFTDLQINGKASKFGIISRRSIHRPGTRYQVRGIDSDGNVANYVETEQVLIYDQKLSSFVQIRGSIPAFWTQNVTIQYAPPIIVSKNDANSLSAFKAHFESLNGIYDGNIVCVNLADQKGREKEIVAKYGELSKLSGLSFVKYFPFDFHTECKGMKYENIAILLNNIEAYLDEMGWFDGSKLQKGVSRTNCIDNLDRTNVVQSFFAKHMLMKQFQSLGINFNEEFKNMRSIFNNTWANNADALSNQYASAPAMKTDFTRTGKRTKFGAVMDGVYSVQRYILNNFTDGMKTDAFNLFLGNYKVLPNQPSPFKEKSTIQNFRALILLLILIVFIVIGSPIPGGWLLLLASLGAAGFFVKKNGKKLVQNPILLTDEQKKKWD